MRVCIIITFASLSAVALAQEPDDPIPAVEEPFDAPLPGPPPDPDPDAPAAPDEVEPVPAFSPAGAQFEARLKELAEHIKKNNPGNDHRVHNRIVLMTARTGARSWLAREQAWNDDKVRFAVGRETEMTNPLAAIKAAEAKANAVLEGVSTSNSRRLLDWFIDDEGVAYALVARWLTLEEREE